MKKYRSTRGMKSHRRNRCTLHKNHLKDFKAWLEENTIWMVLPCTKHPYEVLRAQEYSQSGTMPDSFIYRNDHNDHLTVQADLVPLVRQWLNERKRHDRPRKDVC